MADGTRREEPTPPEHDSRSRLDDLSRQCDSRVVPRIRRKLGFPLRRRVTSDDILQEALLDAARRLPEGSPRLEQPSGFFAWLSRVVDQKIRDQGRRHVRAARRSVRKEGPLDENDAQVPPAPGRSPSGELAHAERTALVRRAVEALPRRQREIVTLVHLERLSVGEAAERMRKTPGATSVLLHQALTRLRAGLRTEAS